VSRVALVTGGGSGIGLAIAEKLSRNGFRTLITGRDPAKLQHAASLLQKKGGTVRFQVCDVSDPRAVDSLFQSEELKELHVLVNNAGVTAFASLDETSLEDWNRILSINLTGPFLVTQKALPRLIKTRGHIFNIVSVAGKRGFPKAGAYCASKFGLYGLNEVLREEMRAKGVKVTAILPGATDTPIFDGAEGDWDRSKMVRPSDIADSLWLALNQSPNALLEEVVVAPASGAF